MHRYLCGILITGFLTASVFLAAQEPFVGQRPTGKGAAGGEIVSRLMRYDRNADGKLLRSEVTDQRLRRLFDQADADKDGTVTKEELTAFAAKEQTKSRGGLRGGGPGGFGPDGGGPGGDGPPGFGPPGGGPGGRGMGRPQPGEILPRFLRDRLELSAQQEKQIQELQKEVDAKLGKILTDDQKQQLKEMRERGPGGFGPPGGRGGPPGGGEGFPPPPPDQSE
jgi:EF hand